MNMEQFKQVKELAQTGLEERRKHLAQPSTGHVSLGKPLRTVIFTVTWALFLGLGLLVGGVVAGPLGASLVFPVSLFVSLFPAWWASRICRVAAQWERAVILRLGRFHSIKGPGVLFVFPVMDTALFVDTRLLTLDIPHQQVITRDNVPVAVDGVIFFMVKDTERAVVTVQDYRYAISQYAQAALRDVIGSMTLDELLSERDQIQSRIAQAVEERSMAWGIHVDSIRLLDIDMPEDLKRMMSRQASAEREKRATITKAEGDKEAAVNLAAAATTMALSPGAMQLRTLQSLDGLGSSPSNTVVFAVPTDVLELVRGLAQKTLHGKPDVPSQS
ncbi:slipin family protein [Myxococcus stipitatus]|uniref:slipin family protein n=1 Tax=Myxococcus stipitatus TaxID=83455 RepID=UPI003144ECF5